MSTAQRIIKNSGFLYAKMGITMFISFYTTRLILNTLGTADFGLFNIVGGAIAMLGFLNGAMAGATQRFMSYSEGEGNIENKTKIFNISVKLHVAISIIMVIVLLIAGYFFFGFVLNISADRIFAAKVVYGGFIFSTAVTIITVPYDAILNAHENMLYFSIIGIFESILKLGAALLLTVSSSDKLIQYGTMIACIPLISLLIMRVYCHKKYQECEFSPRKYKDKALEKKMISFAGWNFFLVASGMISQYGFSLVLNNFFGVILNAAFAIASQIGGQLTTFSNTMMKALNPVIAKSEGGGNRELMLSASLKGSKYGYLILSFFAIPFIVETPFILGLWLKNVPEWTVLFCRLQLIRALVEQLTVTLGVTMNAQGDIKWYNIFRSIVNISPIVMTYILFKMDYPPYYMYITWILSWGGIGGWLLVYFSKKKCELSYMDFFKIVLLPNILLTVMMGFASMIPIYFIESSLLRLLLVSVISSIVLIISLFSFYTSFSDKKVIQGIFIILLKKYKIIL
jgi:O-antigen/teichoic acid export membrane protein